MGGRREWLPAFLRRDPDIGRIALWAALAGALAGFAGFAITSSRGLDLLWLGELIGIGTYFVLGGVFLLALARIVMFQDYRSAAVPVALFLGSIAGDRLAFVGLPGNVTDGQIRFTRTEFGHLPPPTPEHARCTWDESRSKVRSIDTRRSSPAVTEPTVPGLTEMTHIELAPDGTARVTVTVLTPMTGQPIYRYAGPGAFMPQDASGRAGSLAAGELPREAFDAGGYDPELLAFIDSLLAPAALRSYEWSCPALP